MTQFIDALTIALALFVTAVAYIDWVQGPYKRAKTKQKVGDWSLRFVDASPERVHKWAVQISHLLLRQASYGRSGVSWWKTFVLSVVLSVLFVFLLSDAVPVQSPRSVSSMSIADRLPFPLMVVTLPIHLGYIASVQVTIFMLKRMRHSSLIKSAIFLALDVVVAYAISMALLFGIMLYKLYYEGPDFFGDGAINALTNFILMVVQGPLYAAGSIFGLHSSAFPSAVLALLVVPIAPTLLHPVVWSLLLLIRFTLPWWQKHLSDLLYALYESKQGVLTQIAIGIAVLGKGLQYFISMIPS